MMFHDSMAVAQDKMTQVCLFLERHQLPPTPMNYQVTYTFISKGSQELCKAMEEALRTKQKVDGVFIEHLYYEYLDTGHQQQTEIIQNVDDMVGTLHTSTTQSHRSVIQLIDQVKQCHHDLDEHNLLKTQRALASLKKQADLVVKQQQRYKNILKEVKQAQQKQLQELSNLKQQHLIDPQTGLYKRHYLNQQAEVWRSEQKQLCAISIRIDNLSHFTDQFGELIGDVVLARIAQKIKRYVVESGLPGRTGKQEFTVLLVDVDMETARLIAEKIEKDVSRLKFVSSKGSLNLPPVMLSMGIAQLKASQNFNHLAQRASQAAQKAHIAGQSCYVSAN